MRALAPLWLRLFYAPNDTDDLGNTGSDFGASDPGAFSGSDSGGMSPD
jgi:hypothetical protein